MLDDPIRMPSRLSVVAATLVAGCLIASSTAAAQFPWFKRGAKSDFVAFRDAGGRFSIDRPKDWEVVAGAGETVVTFLQKKREAQLVIGRFRMARALAPTDITDVFASEIETQLLKSNQPNATDLSAKLVQRNGQPVAIIDYERPGLNKQPREHARQYSLPHGQDNYRLTASALKDQFPKYEPMFEQVVESFKILSPQPPPASGPR